MNFPSRTGDLIRSIGQFMIIVAIDVDHDDTGSATIVD